MINAGNIKNSTTNGVCEWTMEQDVANTQCGAQTTAWDMAHKYCQFCGKPVIRKEERAPLRVLDDPDWQAAFEHAKGFTIDDVKAVCAFTVGEPDGAEWRMVGKLENGRYFYLEAGCCYSGWDCSSSGSSQVENTFEDVVKFGCTEEARRELGLRIDYEPSVKCEECELLRKQVNALRREVGIKDGCLQVKNRELDAMHYVWCNGGCEGGVHRWQEKPLTEEIVLEAERNTKRLRQWWESHVYHKEIEGNENA